MISNLEDQNCPTTFNVNNNDGSKRGHMMSNNEKKQNVLDKLISLANEKDVFRELHRYAKELAGQGVPQDLLLEYFQELRLNVDEETEDIVLEVMDLIAGFCSPSSGIYDE